MNPFNLTLGFLLLFGSLPVWAISVSCDPSDNLQFGTIIAPVGANAASATLGLGSDSLSFNGNASSMGNLLASNSVNNPTAAQRGKCTVTGTAGDYFKISPIPSNGAIAFIIPNVQQIPMNMNSTIFYIGGTLDLQAANSGSQSQTFSVTVTLCTYNATNNTCT